MFDVKWGYPIIKALSPLPLLLWIQNVKTMAWESFPGVQFDL